MNNNEVCAHCPDYENTAICPISNDEERAKIAHDLSHMFPVSCKNAARFIHCIDVGASDRMLSTVQKHLKIQAIADLAESKGLSLEALGENDMKELEREVEKEF